MSKQNLMFWMRLLLSLLLSVNVFAATEFVCQIAAVGGTKTDEDYNLLSTWENAMDLAVDITVGSGVAATGNWDAQSGTIADGANVTWNSGTDDGTLIHMTDAGASGTFFVIGDNATDIDNLADNDVISDSTNTITVAGTPSQDVIVTAECYDDDGDISDNVVIDGLTTGSGNYWKVTVPVAERHDGTQTGFTYDTPAAADGINVADPYTIIEWLVIEGAWNAFQTVDLVADECTVRYCVIYDSGGAAISNDYAMTGYAHNNIIIGSTNEGIYQYWNVTAGQRFYVYNNTVSLCSNGVVDGSAGRMIAKNNISYNNTTDWSGTLHADTTHNLSKDATAPALNTYYRSKTLAFVNAGGFDFHLHATTDTDAYDKGTDLSADGNLAFSNDIDDDTRSGTWDVGADAEYAIAAAGGAPQVIMVNIS